MALSALITGGGRGIGLGVAKALAAAGYNLAINGVRPEKDVEPQLDALRAAGVDVCYCPGNIANTADRRDIVQKATKHFGVIDLLVNNAGVAPTIRQDILEVEEQGFDRLMNINLRGTFFLTQLVSRHMIASRKPDNSYKPCIITITSISSIVASVNRGEYCISKAGLSMMTKLFASRLGEFNIPVYEVRPGIVATDMTAGVTEKYDRLIADGLTIEQRWGTPDDVGKVVTSLATGRIPYATGQVIDVSGGMLIPRL
jgi:NAD(P)-dependent dehydrogenase (short-subunit alcohol dehydrogenase family)